VIVSSVQVGCTPAQLDGDAAALDDGLFMGEQLWWLVLGLVIGLIGMLPIVRLLLRRAELRARQAERRARSSERLAELGARTS